MHASTARNELKEKFFQISDNFMAESMKFSKHLGSQPNLAYYLFLHAFTFCKYPYCASAVSLLCGMNIFKLKSILSSTYEMSQTLLTTGTWIKSDSGDIVTM